MQCNRRRGVSRRFHMRPVLLRKCTPIRRFTALSSTISARKLDGSDVISGVGGVLTGGPTASRSGRWKWNWDPRPGVLSTRSEPSISSVSFLEIVSPSPVPPEASRCRCLGLRELFKDLFDPLGGNSNSRVDHCELQLRAFSTNVHRNSAFKREFNGIAEPHLPE